MRETILVADDDVEVLDLVKLILEQKGYEVLTARDGLEAVELYRVESRKIVLVLTDMGMPRLGGWEAFQQIRQINPAAKFIFASGYLDPKLRSEMLEAGAKDFIQKPYVVDQVLRLVRKVIDGHSSSGEAG